MGQGLELITGYTAAPGATVTALTVSAGNSFTVRNARLDSKVRLLQAWAKSQTAGILRIRSPNLHDGVQGIRLNTVVSEVKPLLPYQLAQPLVPQDDLTVEMTGSVVGGDLEWGALLVHYEDLPGIEGRYIDAPTLMQRMVNIFTVSNAITAGAGGSYTGEEAITAEYDQWKAGRDYALLGYLVTAECAAVRWRGVDTGNLGVGGPGDELGADVTRSWFVDLARKHGAKMIPVFNAANKDGILVDVAQDEDATAVTVTTILGELSPGAVI